LCIGGRDAGTNELVIKKYLEESDMVFHTDMAGSPFFVLKAKSASKEELQEVATVTACYSKAWKKGLASTDVFYVSSDQISKEAQSGEHLGKGSFMIRGKTTYVDHEMKLALTVDKDNRVTCGSEQGLKKKNVSYALLTQGEEKASIIAKELQSFFKNGLLDDFIKVIPPGGAKVTKKVRAT
jgi:hypothetical protein